MPSDNRITHIGIAFSVGVFGLLGLGCLWSSDDAAYDTYERSYQRYSWPESALIYSDSIEIIAFMNDTIFWKDSVGLPDDSGFSKMDYWAAKERFNLPHVRFLLKNRSSQDLMTWWRDLAVTRHGDVYEKYPLFVTHGRENDVDNTITVVSDRYFPPPEPFDVIAAGGKRVYQDSIDLVSLFHSWPRIKLEPGRYWVQLLYRNYLWQDTVLPVWVGEIWSDTVWFNVIE